MFSTALKTVTAVALLTTALASSLGANQAEAKVFAGDPGTTSHHSNNHTVGTHQNGGWQPSSTHGHNQGHTNHQNAHHNTQTGAAKNLTAVYLQNGSLREVSPGQWEAYDGAGRFQGSFMRVQLEPNALQMLNQQNGVYITINLTTNTVDIQGSNGQGFHTRAILRTSQRSTPASHGGQIGSPYSSHIVNYTCNEGIPMVVRYENSGNQSFAYVSHDGGPEIAMISAQSGSGSRYVNGRNSIHEKAGTLVANVYGAHDVCYSR